jgi:UrcA family protein
MFAKLPVAALAALTMIATAHASPATQTASDPFATSIAVSISDLNASTPAGAAVVLTRVRAAAETVCGGEPDIRLIGQRTLYQTCVKTTVERVVASLGNPMVTALNHGPTAAILARNGR